MESTLVLLAFLVIATWTDVRSRLIYNWTTYPGILACLAVNGLTGGVEGLEQAIAGMLVCGGVMLFIFLFGGTGGGDLKLIAMMGAGLGLYDGIAAMLWTFVLGAGLALAILIWRVGALQLLGTGVRHLGHVLRARCWVPLTPAERKPLRQETFLAPAALIAVCLVRGEALLDLLGVGGTAG